MQQSETSYQLVMDTTAPPASLYRRCGDARQRLLDLISRIRDDAPLKPALSDTLARFMLWAGNLGAMRQPSSRLSLDQRLADAPEVHGVICQHLDDICEAADDLAGITLGCSSDEPEGFDSDMELEEPFDEAGMIVEVIGEAISSLFRLGILVRKASRIDRFQRALQMSDTVFNDTFDISYVKEKHPKMRDYREDWLSTRLGRLISKRRLFIQYSRDHKARLELESGDLAEGKSSKATTFQLDQLPSSALVPPPGNELEEEDADEVMSVMSASTMSNTLSVLRLPALAELSADGGAFECPICFTLQRFQREKAWIVHAFRDLKAYVCTAGDSDQCNDEYFGDRNTWFEHELHHHRAQYTCTLCRSQQPLYLNAFRSHVAELHPQLADHQVKAVEDVSRQTPTHFDASDCPFCSDWAEQIQQRADPKGRRPSSNTATMVSATRFKRHVALHQEQLAIFAVPRTVEDGDREDGGGTDKSVATSESVSEHHSQTASSHGRAMFKNQIKIFPWVETALAAHDSADTAQTSSMPTEKAPREEKSDLHQDSDKGMTDAPAVTDDPGPLDGDNWPAVFQRSRDMGDDQGETDLIFDPWNRLFSTVEQEKGHSSPRDMGDDLGETDVTLDDFGDLYSPETEPDNWFPLFPETEAEKGHSSDSLRRRHEPLPPIIVEDPSDTLAMKRARNTLAARKSRERKAQRFDELEERIKVKAAERDYWQSIALEANPHLPSYEPTLRPHPRNDDDFAPISLPPSILVEDPAHTAALKRARNTLAARQSRERKFQRIEELEQQAQDLIAEQLHWQRQVPLTPMENEVEQEE